MRCPTCGDEYEPGYTRCATCLVELVPFDAVPLPPRADALLGRFHAALAEPIAALLTRKGIEYEALHLDEADVEILVAAPYRGDVRAELVVNWNDLVATLPEDRVFDVLAEGGTLPGWRDAPAGAWVDREGRLQVSSEPEEAEDDARRVIGPGLTAAGAILLLLGWYLGGDLRPTMVLVGLAGVVIGLFLPR